MAWFTGLFRGDPRIEERDKKAKFEKRVQDLV